MQNSELQGKISQAMLRDQWRFKQRLDALRRGEGKGGLGGNRGWPDLAQQIEQSIRVRERRLKQRPAVKYPPELPIAASRREIAAAIEQNQVVVICGETGSGKTTQLPKICLELGRGIGAMIGHTQPRRVAARAVAGRVAEELGTTLGGGGSGGRGGGQGGGRGGVVGYKMRFMDSVGETTLIKVMTDGILLAETQQDRLLMQYDTLIIDEAHERSLNIDFLLGYLKQLLPRRRDLKLIITSATIDPQRFAAHFGDCPIITVSGRMYPVEVRYRDSAPQKLLEVEEDGRRIESKERDEEEPDLLEAIVQAVEEVIAAGPGDVLVFLSGEREIREATEALEGRLGKHGRGGRVEILPLYARLSWEEQQRVFGKSKGRRIVLATNVAETSLTVPGIRYVVDSGLARISRYAPRSMGGGVGGGVQRLPIEPVSRASANQRMGRCGRVAAGICIRLYSEADFLSRPEFTEPEILRTNLAAVILQMKALRLGAIEDFPFLERPRAKLIADGYQTLVELGAVDRRGELTALGAKLAKLPVDPRIARMILAGREEGVAAEVLIIAAALSIQDPRERPLDKQEAADAAHREFRDEDSDFLAYLKMWKWYHGQGGGAGKLRRACKEKFLSYTRLREWHDVHEQLREVVGEMGR